MLEDGDEKVRQQSLKILTGMTATTGAQLQDQPPLDYNVIEQIVSLLDVANTDMELRNDPPPQFWTDFKTGLYETLAKLLRKVM